jgi:hypothetical protein
MGDYELRLERGDLLVVDNLRLYRAVDFPNFDARVVSPAYDRAFLLPSYAERERQPYMPRPYSGGARPPVAR